jgi:hypothetical protein
LRQFIRGVPRLNKKFSLPNFKGGGVLQTAGSPCFSHSGESAFLNEEDGIEWAVKWRTLLLTAALLSFRSSHAQWQWRNGRVAESV